MVSKLGLRFHRAHENALIVGRPRRILRMPTQHRTITGMQKLVLASILAALSVTYARHDSGGVIVHYEAQQVDPESYLRLLEQQRALQSDPLLSPATYLPSVSALPSREERE